MPADFSRDSLKSLVFCECAKNNAANKSPTPVNEALILGIFSTTRVLFPSKTKQDMKNKVILKEQTMYKT